MQLFCAYWVKFGSEKSQVNVTFVLTTTWQAMIPMCIRVDMPADFLFSTAASWTVSIFRVSIMFVPKGSAALECRQESTC